MGRVSAAIEVVFALPQAVSLALGSLLVVLLSYRQIFVIIAIVTAVAAVYIATFLRDQIFGSRPVAVTLGSPAPSPDMGTPVVHPSLPND
jgi:predicted MFS family arabinose efflux permease